MLIQPLCENFFWLSANQLQAGGLTHFHLLETAIDMMIEYHGRMYLMHMIRVNWRILHKGGRILHLMTKEDII